MNKIKRVIFWIILLLFPLICIEFILHFFSQKKIHSSPILTREPILISDSKLGIRGNPRFPEHDSNGFRNYSIPKQGISKIITLGDSQTYGWGIQREKAWPAQLELLSGHRTYNMAIESSGPVHHFLLLEEALALKPKLIIMAIYSGNDAFDAYSAVYEKNLFQAIKSTDKGVLEKLFNLEKKQPLHQEIEKQAAIAYLDDRPYYSPPHFFLIKHSKIAHLAVFLWNSVTHQQREWNSIRLQAQKTAPYRPYHEKGKVSTVFTPNYRLLALNQDDLRIQEGIRLIQEVLRKSMRRIQSSQTQFLVLLIPTKEMAYSISEIGTTSPYYERLIQMEEKFWKQIHLSLDQSDIPYIDLVPVFQKNIDKNKPIYSMTWDGHPNALGHQMITETVCDYLKSSPRNPIRKVSSALLP